MTALSIVLFLAGAAVIAYPYVNGALVDNAIFQEASSFLERASPKEENKNNVLPSASIDETLSEEETPKEHRALWEDMTAYNKNIFENKQASTANSNVFALSPFQLTNYDLSDEVFGVISIPKLDLEMPIFLGASDEHMAAGAAILNQTSIPIGGINTNAVIGGHRGYRGASYFLHVPELIPGDEVIITNLWETLTYIVVGTDIIDPNDVEKILIQEGKDMVTLMTCHPYASGGKYRYLVYCERQS